MGWKLRRGFLASGPAALDWAPAQLSPHTLIVRAPFHPKTLRVRKLTTDFAWANARPDDALARAHNPVRHWCSPRLARYTHLHTYAPVWGSLFSILLRHTELALARRYKDKVEAAYQREALLERHATSMATWGTCCRNVNIVAFIRNAAT
jgi:hypothetical protein